MKYSENTVPKDYTCEKCGAHGVKLWREYNTFLSSQHYTCAKCSFEVQEKPVMPVDEYGQYEGKYGPSDQIGWLVPAIPTEDETTFWGYSSVPQEGCEWWYRLPAEVQK